MEERWREVGREREREGEGEDREGGRKYWIGNESMHPTKYSDGVLTNWVQSCNFWLLIVSLV